MKVLSVGNGTSPILPAHYDGWDRVTLDIDASVCPDIILDARELQTLPPNQYEAVFCSHNLEHFYEHEVPKVLRGFLHVLKEGGFVEIWVPDLLQTFKTMMERDLELTDIYYRSPSGPITFHDTIYGYSKVMADGNLFYAHKCGFTIHTLSEALRLAGFRDIGVGRANTNATARGRK
jgi:hypothetical protein